MSEPSVPYSRKPVLFASQIHLRIVMLTSELGSEEREGFHPVFNPLPFEKDIDKQV
jgi:hypothetical protein